MCPACYAAIAWAVAGSTTVGGVTTLALAKVVRSKIKRATKIVQDP